MTDEADDEQDDLEARAYIAGERMVWRNLLDLALRGLGEEAPDAARLVLQLEQVRASLRQACEEFGDNTWTDRASLADVVDKYLVPYLREEDNE